MQNKKNVKRIRISVPMTVEMDLRIERLSKELAISKSSLCAFLISQAMIQKETEMKIMHVDNLNRIMQQELERKDKHESE